MYGTHPYSHIRVMKILQNFNSIHDEVTASLRGKKKANNVKLLPSVDSQSVHLTFFCVIDAIGWFPDIGFGFCEKKRRCHLIIRRGLISQSSMWVRNGWADDGFQFFCIIPYIPFIT